MQNEGFTMLNRAQTTTAALREKLALLVSHLNPQGEYTQVNQEETPFGEEKDLSANPHGQAIGTYQQDGVKESKHVQKSQAASTVVVVENTKSSFQQTDDLEFSESDGEIDEDFLEGESLKKTKCRKPTTREGFVGSLVAALIFLVLAFELRKTNSSTALWLLFLASAGSAIFLGRKEKEWISQQMGGHLSVSRLTNRRPESPGIDMSNPFSVGNEYEDLPGIEDTEEKFSSQASDTKVGEQADVHLNVNGNDFSDISGVSDSEEDRTLTISSPKINRK
jgi:hypothetical protein